MRFAKKEGKATRLKCCACRAMNMDVTTAFDTLWHLQTHVGMSKRHATRNKETSKRVPRGAAIEPSRERMRTVAVVQRRANTQPTNPQSEMGALWSPCYAFGLFKAQGQNKMQPTNPCAHTYVNGTDVETHGYAVTHNTFLKQFIWTVLYIFPLLHPVTIPVHRRLWNMEEGGVLSVECGV